MTITNTEISLSPGLSRIFPSIDNDPVFPRHVLLLAEEYETWPDKVNVPLVVVSPQEAYEYFILLFSEDTDTRKLNDDWTAFSNSDQRHQSSENNGFG